MNLALRISALALAGLAFASAPAQAQHRGHGGGGHYYRGGGHGHWGPGVFWGGVGLGIGLGAGAYYYGSPYYGYAPSYSSGYIVIPQSDSVVYDAPLQTRSSVPAAPEPVVYPRNGQTAAQTESDRQACNRWATSQPAAMNDASIFQRATLACLEGRGYTVK